MPPIIRPKTLILDIRGGHGAGKTWIINRLTELYGREELGPTGCWLIPKIDAVVCRTDRGSSPSEIEAKIGVGIQHRRLLIEGTISSHTRGRYVEMAESGRYNYRFLFLDTPSDKCIERVMSRRTGTKNRFTDKPFNPKNIEQEYNKSRQIREWLIEKGFTIIDVPFADPMPVILRELNV